MAVDKIIVQTLERSVNRHWAFMGASSMMNVPPNLIHFAIGKDNKDKEFDNNISKVVHAAEDDGFPFVAEYAKAEPRKGTEINAATICQVWNYARILREIVNKEMIAMVIFDDKMLNIEYSFFENVLDEVMDVRGETFYALQLLLRGSVDDVELPKKTLAQRIRTSNEVFQGTFGNVEGNYVDLFFQQGMSGYDETMVFSPKGAAWFLKCLELSPDFYQYLDHFICKAMPKFAKEAVKRKKGVYSPSELGYKFVSEFMNMGTTTDWATTDSTMFEESQKITELNYIFGKPSTIKDGKDSKTSKSETKSLTSKLKDVLDA